MSGSGGPGTAPAAAAANQTPLNDFTNLSSSIHLYQPPSRPGKEEQNESPSLIVLCTWMGASLRHVKKYTAAYQRIYPTATILVIESALPDMLWRPTSTQQTRITPARDVLLAAQAETATPKILLHAFSNGGANTATQLAASIAASSDVAKKSTSVFCGIILDSCPGRDTHGRAVRAISTTLPPSPVIQILGAFLVHIYLVFLTLLRIFLGHESKVAKARRELNDEKVFGKKVPRLYIYSAEDEMIFWKDVQDHAEEARKKGFEGVYALPFQEGRHCAHVLKDEARYWGAVEKLVAGGGA